MSTLDEGKALKLAKATDTPKKKLNELAGRFQKVDRVLAKRPDVSATLLNKLSRCDDRITRRNVAANPNCNTKTLLRLAPHFPAEVLDHPGCSLKLLEDAEGFAGFNNRLVLAMLERPPYWDFFRRWSANSCSERVCELMKLKNSALRAQDITLERLKGRAKTLVQALIEGGVEALSAAEARDRRLVNQDSIQKALEIALLRRDRASCNWLLLHGADLRSAIDEVLFWFQEDQYYAALYTDFWYDDDESLPAYGTLEQKRRKYICYPDWLLEDLASSLITANLRGFWKDVFLFEERPACRQIATDAVLLQLNKRDAERAIRRRKKIESDSAQHEAMCRDQTHLFVERLERLIQALRHNRVFAENLDILCSDARAWWEYSDFISEAGDYYSKGSCIFNTRIGVAASSLLIDDRRVFLSPVESTACQYSGSDEEETRNVAKTIVRLAPLFGLSASWGGDTSVMLHVSLDLSSKARKGRALFLESEIAGFGYFRGETIWSSLEVDAELTLVREPNNKYDPNAVALYFGKDKLGFVPSDKNHHIARMLDEGMNLEAYISDLDPEGEVWEKAHFAVWVV